MKLRRRYVEKPWGRTRLPAMFDPPSGKRIGEVWFESGSDLPLLAKSIFTSEKLSVQVHPDDEQARARGLRSGKSECWYILDAEPDAILGLGLRRKISADELRSAALDGSIENLLDWRPVAVGDFYSVPAGTIHAVGGGLSLLEFQQNSDVTYRLYDYGRPRELHVDDAVAVARAEPYPASLATNLRGDEERVLVDGPHFTLLHSHHDALMDRQRWVMPLEGQVRCRSESAGPGDCMLAGPGETVDGAARMLIGARA
jgi:mannose-6-phosphate isomerase